MIIFLYVKTHNKTGLKYLGQTQRDDPYSYPGSGIYWRQHLKEYGDDVLTELIAAFDNLDDLKVAGKFWSYHFNVVISDEWANLIEEYGTGGYTSPERQAAKLKQERLNRANEITYLVWQFNGVFEYPGDRMVQEWKTQQRSENFKRQILWMQKCRINVILKSLRDEPNWTPVTKRNFLEELKRLSPKRAEAYELEQKKLAQAKVKYRKMLNEYNDVMRR